MSTIIKSFRIEPELVEKCEQLALHLSDEMLIKVTDADVIRLAIKELIKKYGGEVK
jgi:hypothetical protein